MTRDGVLAEFDVITFQDMNDQVECLAADLLEQGASDEYIRDCRKYLTARLLERFRDARAEFVRWLDDPSAPSTKLH